MRLQQTLAIGALWIAAAFTSQGCIGCGGGDDGGFIECRDDTSCGLAADGRCLVNPVTGNQFCAYPDAECADTGMRWSDLDVEDSIAGTCVAAPDAGVPEVDAAPDAMTEYQVTVTVGGNGTGAVASEPPGINCSAGTCMASFTSGTTVILTATPSDGVFLGWSDACTGVAACSIILKADATAGALFGVPGEALWADQVGAASTGDIINEVSVDGEDNVLVVGTFSGTVDVGGVSLTSAGARDVLVAKLNSSTGVAIWAKRFGGSSSDEGTAIGVDGSGNVFVGGNFQGNVNFGADRFTSAGSTDVFVMKLNGVDGSHVWSRAFGNTGYDTSHALTVDTSGDVILAGGFRVSINFGGSTLTSLGVDDVYLAKFTGLAGGHVWSRAFGGTVTDIAYGIVADANGDVIATGEFATTVNFGGGNLTSAGAADVWVAKYSAATGAYLFAQRYGSTGIDIGAGLALNNQGQVFLAGRFEGTVSFGGGSPLVATTGDDIVLAKYSIAGAHLWSKSFGGTGSEFANGTSVDSAGNVAIIGNFCGTLNIGGADMSSASACSQFDVFVGRFNGATGAHLGSGRYGGSGHEVGKDIAQSSDGRMYGVGLFNGFSEFGGTAYTSAGGDDGFIIGLAPLN